MMGTIPAIRQEARQALHVYMSRAGLGLRAVADRIGCAHYTLRQFSSGSHYGNMGDVVGRSLGHAVLDYIAAHPAPMPELPGRLYETAATREMDRMLSYIGRGRWGTLYGPAGAQKTFLLEYRAAEAARRETEQRIVYIRTSPSGMSPTVLLRRIAQALAAPYAQYCDEIRQSVIESLRLHSSCVALILDEAQHLYSRIDTLETLRELGDVARAKVGILVAGNEQVLRLFEARRSIHFEQWRSRIQQRELRVLGPSREEARTMILGEIPGMRAKQIEALLAGCAVNDPVTRREYINARRLFNTLRDIGEASPM